MPRILAFILLLLFSLAVLFYFFFPPTLYQGALERRLRALSVATQSQDRAVIKDALTLAFTPSARISLEMQPAALPGQEPVKAAAQNFTTADFLNFVDTLLYSVKDYGLDISLESFALAADRKTAKLHFNTHAQAQDVTGMSATENMRLYIDAPCEGEVYYQSPAQPLFNRISCTISLHYSLSKRH